MKYIASEVLPIDQEIDFFSLIQIF